MTASRRTFLRTAASAGLAGGLADLPGLLSLSPVKAADAKVTPDAVELSSDIEPLVRLIEETPREKILDMAVGQLKTGVPYRQLLAALFLAGIRNVSPQPPGFKFHCVFVIHSAHQLSLDAPAGQRLLPLFWALDYFKGSQAKDVEEGDFVLKPVTGKLPSPEAALEEFHAAMDDWDEERADRAAAALARSRGALEIVENFWRYGARDYRNIGHKAIFVANTWRTLQTIGWRHAEPALRSLVLGLLDFGRDRRLNDYAYADQSYLPNQELVEKSLGKLPGTWTAAGGDPAVTRDLLELVRGGKADEAARTAIDALAGGTARAGCVWDAVHLAAGELMMRQPGIYGIHTVTSANALRYAFRTAADPATRLVVLLQGLGWMSQFRNFMSGARGGLEDVRITALEPAAVPESPDAAADRILGTLADDRAEAARYALAYAERHPDPQHLAAAARRLIFTKGSDAHDYKYAAAIFEDYRLVTPRLRPQMLATAVYNLRGTGHPDTPLMQRAREAVKGLS